MMRYPIVGALAILTILSDADAQWAQFGGQGRDFTVPDAAIATDWPHAGPPRLWTRDLGEGYSGISISGGSLFTMLRRGENEIAVALDAATGEPLWEAENPAPFWDGLRPEHGPGPHATPLVTEGRVYVAGIRGVLRCLDAGTGKEIWARDLWNDYGSQPGNRGYASSPIAYGSTVIVPVGGKGQGLVAFDRATGREVWKGGDFGITFSSPVLVTVDGQEQLLLFNHAGLTGLNPTNGEVLWHHPHETRYGLNIALPVRGPDNVLFMSAAYDSGARGIRLSSPDRKASIEELWYNRTAQIHHASAVRISDTVYASIGSFGPAFLAGIDVRSGEILFRQRGFAKANLLALGDHILLLDEDGRLAVGIPGSDEIDILSEAQVLTHKAWTAPSYHEGILYLRDRKTITALDLRR